ncbi:unnamed protein product [Rotaria sordida]|uniref:Transmembrane protein n=1 Tax=Rotaria sordida TaxID=392033 RepID=A0A815YFJ6_9BILA|nr:unnamed protein product [Rotaria sordida]CAF1570117.1 unnamed protein product [Rotaria sordida]
MRIKTLSYNVLFLFSLSFISIVQCNLLNISLAIINTQTVIACGLSIDIYSSFDPTRIIICPYVSTEQDKIQLIYMNISFDKYDQIKIELNPRIISTPKLLIKLDNNSSFISAPSINQNYTYYLSFSSELTCRFSLLNNETICFYYPTTTNFIHIEYHYDKIKYGSWILLNKIRYRFYNIFIIITIIMIICVFTTYVLYKNRVLLRHTAELDSISNSEMVKQEEVTQPTDSLQDNTIKQPILVEDFIIKKTHTNSII